MTVAVDLFAGVGWCVAARELGLDPLGIELDEQACATRKAAGMRTLQADVSALNPADFAPCELLIASPPCTAFSMAGKGKGREALFAYATAIEHMRHGAGIDRERLDRECDDKTAHLVLEPLRWALALCPWLIVCEQVPPVLPLWERMADVLRGCGYSVWAGVLEAERYGVPQTRERAIIMASSIGVVHPPRPTHQRHVPGEPARHEITLEGELLPWISMAEALGWGMAERPCISITAGSGRQGGPDPLDGGSGARATLRRERERAWVEPPTHYDRRQQSNGVPVRQIPVTDPAPTIASDGLAKGRDTWIVGQQRVAGESEQRDPRGLNEPSYTIRANAGGGSNGVGRSGGVQWTTERPATAVQGDPRISPPGWRGNPEDYKRPEGPTRSGDNAVRVTVEEAATLQSFPPDFPWQGPKTAKFRQIGNAVPPKLAKAILSALLEVRARAAA